VLPRASSSLSSCLGPRIVAGRVLAETGYRGACLQACDVRVEAAGSRRLLWAKRRFVDSSGLAVIVGTPLQ
jgi:hypothetical protein